MWHPVHRWFAAPPHYKAHVSFFPIVFFSSNISFAKLSLPEHRRTARHHLRTHRSRSQAVRPPCRPSFVRGHFGGTFISKDNENENHECGIFLSDIVGI